MDWTAKTSGFFVDNTLRVVGGSFRDTSFTGIKEVILYNHENSDAWWDEIRSHPLKPLREGPWLDYPQDRAGRW